MTRWTGVLVLVACAVLTEGCGATGGADDSDGGTASRSALSTKPIELALPAAQGGRCMPPSVDNLKAQDTAFEGTVTTLSDDIATLQVTQTYKGAEADTATVAIPAAGLSDLILAVDFEQGQTYLVSSLGGKVSVCGLSGPKDKTLTGLYEQAYPD